MNPQSDLIAENPSDHQSASLENPFVEPMASVDTTATLRHRNHSAPQFIPRVDEATVHTSPVYDGRYESTAQQEREIAKLRAKIRDGAMRCKMAILWWWEVMIVCIRLFLGDEDTGVDDLPEQLQRMVGWYKRGGRKLVAIALGAAVLIAALFVLYIAGLVVSGIVITLIGGETTTFKADTHRFNAEDITVKRFKTPYDIDHIFNCECTPVLLAGRVPTRRMPLYNKQLNEEDLLREDSEERPAAFVPYDNLFWVNSQLLQRYMDDVQTDEIFMTPKMWNISGSPQDVEFLSKYREFNPCVLTIRKNVTLINMINPRIIRRNYQSDGDESATRSSSAQSDETLNVKHYPTVFAPFMKKDISYLISEVQDSFKIRFYEWPHMTKRVWTLVPDSIAPDFRIFLQLALIAMDTGYKDELDNHGPFITFQDETTSKTNRKVISDEDEPISETTTTKMDLIAEFDEETIADTDDADNESDSVETTYVARTVNGKQIFMTLREAKEFDSVQKQEL